MSAEILWHRKDWATIMLKHGGEYLTYRRGERLDAPGPVALKVNGTNHEWTDAGRQQFEAEAPVTMNVEVTFGTARRRSVCVYEYRQPGPGPAPKTP